ncbi:PadR family transcriptional regulator [Micromonospora sp. DT4]|uniref:PadR family transcriptional regulator n=1 Tax=Micromonospora sp. DT4 TaxID=3393438 RepID=UPI003CF15BBB
MDIPLREPTFLILTALAVEPMHGYGLIGEVATLSDNRVSLRPGTLYGALDRLVDAGLVEVDREEVVDGRLRRYYRLCPAGDATLTAETERADLAVPQRQRIAGRPAHAYGATSRPPPLDWPSGPAPPGRPSRASNDDHEFSQSYCPCCHPSTS